MEVKFVQNREAPTYPESGCSAKVEHELTSTQYRLFLRPRAKKRSLISKIITTLVRYQNELCMKQKEVFGV